jgi:putative phage-type endonuclease
LVKQQLSKAGIGASEIATICGLSPYSSPWDIWRRRVDGAPDVESTPPMEWGNRLEPAIRQKYVDETGYLVRIPAESMFHPKFNWARATPDGIALDAPNASEHLIQIKNVGAWVGREWDAGPPTYVQLQTQWEMFVTGYTRDDVACLIGGSDYRCFTVHRDDKTINDLVTIASDFMRRVEQRIPPEIDNSQACKEHFEKRFAKQNAIELRADADLESLFTDWHQHIKTLKHSTKEVERIRNVVRSHLADAQADRIVSSIGVAKLDANKKLLTPREWSKEDHL